MKKTTLLILLILSIVILTGCGEEPEQDVKIVVPEKIWFESIWDVHIAPGKGYRMGFGGYSLFEVKKFTIEKISYKTTCYVDCENQTVCAYREETCEVELDNSSIKIEEHWRHPMIKSLEEDVTIIVKIKANRSETIHW